MTIDIIKDVIYNLYCQVVWQGSSGSKQIIERASRAFREYGSEVGMADAMALPRASGDKDMRERIRSTTRDDYLSTFADVRSLFGLPE